MSQHGRRRAAASAPVVDDEPARRFGFLTMETALVLGLVALIAAGSFLVHLAFPSNRESETTIGDQKVRITTVGKDGVLPGPVEPRVVQVVVPTPVPVKVVAKQPKPRRTAPAVPAAPTPTPTPTPTGGGITSPRPGGGGGGECTVLILCKPGEKPAPTPTPTPRSSATQQPVQQDPAPQDPAPQQPGAEQPARPPAQ